MPKVSIVVATRDNEHYIATAIQSALNQSFGDFELIVTDDASSDSTFDQLLQFSDPRLTLLRNSSSMGMAGALNRSASVATGEYVAWLGAEDSFEPHMLDSLVTYLEGNPKKFGVFGLAKSLNQAGEKFDASDNIGVNAGRFELLNLLFRKHNPFARSGGIARRDVVMELGCMPPEFSRMYELALWIKLLFHGELDVIPDYVVCNRMDSVGALAVNEAGYLNAAALEDFELLNLYTEHIVDTDQLMKIFPEIKNVNLPVHDQLIKFHIALTAISCSSVSNQLFGLHLMHELMKKPDMVECLKSDCGFTYTDMFDMIEALNIFTNGANKLDLVALQDQIAASNSELVVALEKESNTVGLKEVIGDLPLNYQYSLLPFHVVSGVLPPEGPHPSLGIPYIFYWCCGPAAKLQLVSERPGWHLLTIECASHHFERLNVDVTLGTEYSARLELKKRGGDRPKCYQAKIYLEPGMHDVTLTPSQWQQPTPEDPRSLAFMLRGIKLWECF